MKKNPLSPETRNLISIHTTNMYEKNKYGKIWNVCTENTETRALEIFSMVFVICSAAKCTSHTVLMVLSVKMFWLETIILTATDAFHAIM